MNTITIKEIATAVGVSVSTVRRREKDWGLDEARSHASRHARLYFRRKATEILFKAGVLIPH